MLITIDTDSVFLEVRQKSHLNVQDIQDPEARDNARAGVEKTDEIEHCIVDAFAQLTRRCARFIVEAMAAEADNWRVMPSSYTYDLALSERRAINKAEPLAAVMHAFVVAYTLAKFYSSVSQGGLSNAYSLQAVELGNQLDEMLYTKQPPRL